MTNSAGPGFTAHPTLRPTSTNYPERLLNINEVAAWLGVSKAWVYDHVTRKPPRLPCIRFGEVTRFRSSDIQKFIEKHAGGSTGSD